MLANNNLGHENVHAFPLSYYKYGKNNTRHFTFQQTYKTIPVFGRYIRVHIRNNNITSLSSNIDNIHLSIVPIITKPQALNIIKQTNIATSSYLQYNNLQIYLYNSTPHLVHTVDAVNIESSWRYMVDAHTGMIVHKF